MSASTDLSTLQIVHHETSRSKATLTGAAISISGAYYATSDEMGNIFVCRTDNKTLVRNLHLEGPVHILKFIQMRTKIMLIGATKTGNLRAWQLNSTSNIIRMDMKYPFCVNAFAFNASLSLMAVSTGLETWTRQTQSADIQTFYKYPLAIGLHFTPLGDLLISYLAGYSMVECKAPYEILNRKATDLPSRIGHTSLSPSGRYAISGNLFNGFDIFDIVRNKFVKTSDYLVRTSGATFSYSIKTTGSSFLNDKFLVTGHRDPAVCIFQLNGDEIGTSLMFNLHGSEAGSGVQHLAAGFYKNKPFVIALNGSGVSSQVYILGGPSLQEPIRNLIIHPRGIKAQFLSRWFKFCRIAFLISLLVMVLGVVIVILPAVLNMYRFVYTYAS